jgi:hypothetical protein
MACRSGHPQRQHACRRQGLHAACRGHAAQRNCGAEGVVMCSATMVRRVCLTALAALACTTARRCSCAAAAAFAAAAAGAAWRARRACGRRLWAWEGACLVAGGGCACAGGWGCACGCGCWGGRCGCGCLCCSSSVTSRRVWSCGRKGGPAQHSWACWGGQPWKVTNAAVLLPRAPPSLPCSAPPPHTHKQPPQSPPASAAAPGQRPGRAPPGTARMIWPWWRPRRHAGSS